MRRPLEFADLRQIVGNLIGLAEPRAEAERPRARRLASRCRDGAQLRRRAEQDAGLEVDDGLVIAGGIIFFGMPAVARRTLEGGAVEMFLVGPFRHGRDDLRHQAAFRLALFDHLVNDGGEHDVAEEHGLAGPLKRPFRRPTAPQGVAIDKIVVDQRGGVQTFDADGSRDRRLDIAAQRLAGETDETTADPLACRHGPEHGFQVRFARAAEELRNPLPEVALDPMPYPLPVFGEP